VDFNQSAAQLQQLRAETATMHEDTARKLREMEERHAEATKELSYVIKYVKEGLTKMYEGDLSYRLEEYFPYDFKSIRMDFNQAAAKLEDAMAAILHGAQSMNATASSISSSADQLAQRTEQQAAGLEQTAAALEQITSTIKNNAANAKRVSDVAVAAGEDASAGSHVLRNTRDAMSKIERSSTEVARILGVIDEIAFQTNLLALNAGVEAARAALAATPRIASKPAAEPSVRSCEFRRPGFAPLAPLLLPNVYLS
jgi:methyl-accepting chemotaxis protein